MLRPANYSGTVPGSGYMILPINGWRVLVISVLGAVHMEPQLDSPFHTVDRILSREEGHYDLAVVDLHAEATAEKLCLAAYLDGRVSILFGTHTHVQTADETILPAGTGFLTDLGMCGSTAGVLGMKKETAVRRFLDHMPSAYETAEGAMEAQGALFELDPDSGRCLSVQRVDIT